jgi:transposase
MVSRRRRFNREFKIETVKLVTDSDNSVTQIAADMGVHPNTLYKWASSIPISLRKRFPVLVI